MDALEMKQSIAVAIGLQTHVLKFCPVHRVPYLDDDVDPASAFALSIELVRAHSPYVEAFQNDEHALTDLLSETLGNMPTCCRQCQPPAMLGALNNRGGFAERLLESR
jgi:hypothetical protein